MTETFAYDVFLSHAALDKAVVHRLAERLRDDGLRVWLDDWEIRPGDLIGLKIEEGLENSRTLVLAMSANAFTSEWVTLERHTALFRDPTSAQRRFIPLRLDDAEIKDTLRQYAYVDWRQPSDEQYARLLAACRPPFAEAFFQDFGLTLAEINPIARLENGAFVALDGHVDMEAEVRD